MPNQPFLTFPYLVTLVITMVSFANGCLAGNLFARRRWWQTGLLFALAGCLLSVLYFWYGQTYREDRQWVLWAAYLACGWMVANLMAILPMVLIRLCAFFRRGRLFCRVLGAAVLAGSLSAGVYGAVDGNQHKDVDEISLEIKGLPLQFEGFKIAQISDTHIGPYYRYPSLDGDLYEASQYGVDLVAFTGDLIDDVGVMPQAAQILDARSPLFPYGIEYIWGNHEYYRGKEYIRNALEKTRVHILENEHTQIRKNGGILYIVGVDYPWGARKDLPAIEEAMAEEAFRGVPQGAPVIFLAHHSDFIDEGRERGAALTLTGHTHGMQIGWNGQSLIPLYKYLRGLYSGEGVFGYVSRGTGHWFPFRLGCSREITIFTLHQKK